MNLQNDFDLGQMTSLHRKLHCLTGDVCISCAQLLATWCYCRPPHSQSKLTFETNISSCFHNQQNDDICSGCEPQHTHTRWISVPSTQNFCHPLFPVLLSVYICSVRGIPDWKLISAAFSVPRAARAPGIKLLAVIRAALCSLKPFKRMEADTDFPLCQQAVKCSSPESSLLLPSCWNAKVRNYPLVPKSTLMFIWKSSSWKIETLLTMRHLSWVTLSRIWHNCHISPNRNLW